MNKSYLTHALLLTISTTAFADSSDDLRWIAQDYKPYSYIDRQGKQDGVAIDIAELIMHKIGSRKTAQDIEVKVFSRSFVRKNNDPNTVFFPLAKLPEREKYFKWVGPIALDEPVLFAKISKNIVINMPDDLKKYNIAVKDGYNAVKLLKDLGVKGGSINYGDDDIKGLAKLKADQVDLVACNRLSCQVMMKDNKMDAKDYSIVYRLQPSELAMAFNKDTSDELVSKVNDALIELKKSKEYNVIMEKWTKTN